MQIDSLNLDISVRNNEREAFSQTRCSHFGGSHPTETLFHNHKKEKGYKKPPFNSRNSNNKQNQLNYHKPNTCFRCGSEDNFIANCPRRVTWDKKVQWNTENPKACAHRSTEIDIMSENSTDESESKKIYASMVRISPNS